MRRVSIILFLFSIVLCCNYKVTASNTLDSLLRDLNFQKQDTSQVKTLLEIVSLLVDDENPDAEKYALKAIDKSFLISKPEYFSRSIHYYIRTGNKKDLAKQLQFLDKLLLKCSGHDYAKQSILFLYKGILFENIDSTLLAAKMYNKSTQLAVQSKDTLTIIDAYTSKGIFFKRKSNYTLALEALITALRYSEFSGKTDGIFPICINLGTIYEQMLDNDKAVELYKKAEKIINKTEDPNGMAIVDYKIGKVLLKQYKYAESKKYLENVYKIHVSRNDRDGLIVSSAALSGIAYEQKQYDEFLKWIKISLDNAKLTNNQQGLASAYSSYGKYYAEVEKNYSKALEYYNINMTLDLEKIQLSHLCTVYKQIYILHEKLGDYKKAFEFYKLYSTINDSLYNSNNVKKQTELKLEYEFDKIQHQKEIEDKLKEKAQNLLLEKERQRRNYSIIVGVLAIILLVLSYRSYRIKIRANSLLRKQKLEIERQKKLVDEKNKEISDSINYARHIQTSILPLDEELKNSFLSYVLYFRPKDVVSGDFYWHIDFSDKIFFAVVDCTGHGVPGSIMSIIGNILLNEIIMEKKIHDPAQMLFILNNLVKQTLRQGENLSNRVKDGMDIAICAYDKKENKLWYAGANMPLYVVSNSGDLKVYKADKAAIGGYTNENFQFTKNEILMEDHDWIYLFSDGFADQFGGDRNKKYTLKKLKSLFTEMLNLSPEEKMKALEKEHLLWKQGNEQTDDILVFGFEANKTKS